MNNNSSTLIFKTFPVFKTILKISLFTFSLLLILFVLLIASFKKVNFKNNVIATQNKKRIILVGCSNLDYNYNDSLLSKSIPPDYQIIKLHTSLSAGLFPLLENMKDNNITDQDIVVYCLPLNLFNFESFSPVYNADFVIRMNQNRWQSLYKNYPLHLLKSFRNYNNIANNVFHILTENKYYSTIDNFSNGKPNDYFSYNPEFLKYARINITYFDTTYINNTISILQNQKGKHVFRFEPLVSGNCNIPAHLTDFLQSHAPYINQQQLFPKNFSHKSPYHLNFQGALKNTTFFTKEIKPFLK